ncbi:unnamed protein product [Thelazia callipaeda]|uniref:UBA domain-containing protein n=1 Tax=Thelazia callipaeda TaxID=103827 RepID=A0A158RBW4_THECL|nr:unnamed protein product [Thelazia callipaeda]
MKITVTCNLTGDDAFLIEITADMLIENFLLVCRSEIPSLQNIPVWQMSILHNGYTTIMDGENLKKTIRDMHIFDNDIVMVSATKPVASSSEAESSSNLIADLVRSIKVPGDKKPLRDMVLRPSDIRMLRFLFDSLRANDQARDRYRVIMPDLVAAAEQNNFDAFTKQYLVDREESLSKANMVFDPTNVEGQRMIAEQIQRDNIDFSHRFAMEHMPEVYIPVTMLYINMKINGVEVQALVDSGAQVSILSDNVAQRCNLMRLVDERFKGTLSGVGGLREILGKIHACQVQIEQQFFPCSFNVLVNHHVEVLLGLDILKRHKCSIDLEKNCLRFGTLATTCFLPESEITRTVTPSLLTNPSGLQPEVDSANLASLMALGFEEAAARAMLLECANDVEMAAANLLAKQSSP